VNEFNKPRKVHQIGDGIQGRVYFEVVLDAISESSDLVKTIMAHQEALGYHPMGYGGPMHMRTKVLKEGYLIQWACSASCD
jgi:hypothetical protein